MKSIDDLRREFLEPFSTSDSSSILFAGLASYFQRIANLRSMNSPILGDAVEGLDYRFLRTQKMPLVATSTNETLEDLFSMLEGTVDWAHPLQVIAPSPPPTIVSLFAYFVAAHLLPNFASDLYSQRFIRAEIQTVAMLADIIGYDQLKCAGFSTFGGAATNIYGIKIALEKAMKAISGISTNKLCLFKSENAHASSLVAAKWLNVEPINVITVSSDNNSMNVSDLVSKMRIALDKGYVPAGIVCELGSTFEFAMDRLEEVSEHSKDICKTYNLSMRPHIHADAVIGWVYSFFNDYDFYENPENFEPRAIEGLETIVQNTKQLQLADSIGIDFHKLGFTPLTSSFFLLRDGSDIKYIANQEEFSLEEIYSSFGNYTPAHFTLESTRPAMGPLAAYLNCVLLGKEGFRSLLAYNLGLALYLRDKLGNLPYCRVLNNNNEGPALVIRLYPSALPLPEIEEEILDAQLLERINQFNERCFDEFTTSLLQNHGAAWLSFSRKYKVFPKHSNNSVELSVMKSYVTSPFTSKETIDGAVAVMTQAWEAVCAST
ncbi:MAG: aspartate aminotransferase family protein [Chloroflexi bacterium]|nr:aspartate aminotransferase family protein [Chloroflexota bacterium]